MPSFSSTPTRVAAAVLCTAVLGVPGAPAVPDDANGAEPRTLRVAVKVAPPFVMSAADGSFEGLSIELWRAVAERLNYVAGFEESTLDSLLAGIAAGEYDLGVSATTVTAKRERRADFSHPFFTSGLGIATTTGGRGLGAALKRVFSARFAGAVAGLALLLLGVGFLVWLFERRANPEEFQPAPGKGLWAGFWFAAVSMTTVGYGDKAPRSVAGRLVTLVWMFASIILISFFTAAIATALTVQSLESRVRGPEDLGRVRVASVAGTTSAAYLDGRGIRFDALPSAEDAVRELAEGRADAVVYDRPILRWLLRNRGDSSLEVLPEAFDRQDYAFVLPPGSPIREDINRALLEELQSQRWTRLVEQYLGR